MLAFYGKGLLTLRPTPKLEDYPLSFVRGCLFNIFAANLKLEAVPSIRNPTTHHAVVTRETREPTYHGEQMPRLIKLKNFPAYARISGPYIHLCDISFKVVPLGNDVLLPRVVELLREFMETDFRYLCQCPRCFFLTSSALANRCPLTMHFSWENVKKTGGDELKNIVDTTTPSHCAWQDTF
jgi:hypothetical protein